MSHSTGIIFSKLDYPFIIGYFDYNGTADLCLPKIYDSINSLRDNWRKGSIIYCKENHSREEVIIYSSYGNGFYWNGEICQICKIITSPLSLDSLFELDIKRYDGLPKGVKI